MAVKQWAISVFGTNDKSALLTGIYLSLVLFAVLVGLLAARSPALGVAGIAVLGAIGVYCAATAQGHHSADVIPSIVAGVVGAATLAGLLWVIEPRGDPVDPSGVSRRHLLQAGSVVAGFAVLGTYLGRSWQHERDLTRARNALTLPTPASPAPPLVSGTDLGKGAVPFVTPNAKFYRVDTALAVPEVDPKTWTLQVHGRVDREVTLTYSQLVARPLIERWITLCCVSNEVGGDLISNARFLGARLADVLREAGIHADADQLVATSADGMTIGTPTAAVLDGRDAMLAIGMNGQPLPLNHGFPVRMIVPGLYGYVSACKWIVDLEATTFADTDAYWVARGYGGIHPSCCPHESTHRNRQRACRSGSRSPSRVLRGISTSASAQYRCGSTMALGRTPDWHRCHRSTPGGSGCFPGPCPLRDRVASRFGGSPPTAPNRTRSLVTLTRPGRAGCRSPSPAARWLTAGQPYRTSSAPQKRDQSSA